MDIALNSRDCEWLGGFYFNARYPGDDFVTVSEADAQECLRITEQIRETILKEMEKFQQSKEENNFKKL